MSNYESQYGVSGTTSIPGGSIYAKAALLANQRYKQRLADLNRQRGQTMLSAGYQGDVDPATGLIKNFKVDPTSKFGGFQMLNRAQYQQGQDIRGANIERGLGTGGGLAAQNREAGRFQWGQQDADFARGLQEQLFGLDRSQQDFLYERDRALWEAEQAAAQEAIGQGDYGDYGGGDPGGDPQGDPQGDPGGWPGPMNLGAKPLLPASAVRRAVRRTFAPKKRPARRVVATQRWAGGKKANVVNRRPAPKKKKTVPGKYRAWGPR